MAFAWLGVMTLVHCKHLSSNPSSPGANCMSPWHVGQLLANIVLVVMFSFPFLRLLCIAYMNKKAPILKPGLLWQCCRFATSALFL